MSEGPLPGVARCWGRDDPLDSQVDTGRLEGAGPLPVVARERLLTRLERLLQSRLAVICAPAGYGKTTLVRDLEQRLTGASFCWLSLEVGGGSLPALLRGLAAAVAPHLPGGTHLTLLGGAPGALDEVRDLALRFAGDLAEQADDHLVLVLDDLQVADECPEVWAFLDTLVAALPAEVHLLLASRTRPRLSLARLKSRGDLILLGTDDLSFTAEEGQEFFRALLGRDLPARALDLAIRRTEGWAAGLLLVAHAARGRSAQESVALMDELSRRRDLFDYMAEEVFHALPGALQDFLLKTSVMLALEPALIHELLPGTPVAQHLEAIEARNLFLVPGAGGAYRLHSLFRDFLQQQAIRHLGEQAVAHLHRRLAESLLARERPEHALRHLLAAGAWNVAAPLMARLVDPYLKALRQEEVHRWLQLVPRERVEDDPDILYVRLQSACWLNQFTVVPALYERCLDLYAQMGDRAGLIRTLDSLQHHLYKVRHPFVPRVAATLSQSPDPELSLRGKQLLAAGQLAQGNWVAALEALEQLVVEAPANSAARWDCQEMLALFSFLAADFRRCLRHGVEEVAARNASGDFTWGIYNWAAYAFLGDSVGMEMYQRQFAAQEVPPHARRLAGVVTQFGQAMVHVIKREWADALKALESLAPYYNDGRSLLPSLGPDSTIVARAELARIYWRMGRLDEAHTLLDRNLNLIQGYPEIRALAFAQLAEHWALCRDFPQARLYLQQARAAIPPGLTGLAALAVGVAAAKVLWAAGDLDGAAAELDSVLKVAVEKGCAYIAVHYGAEGLVPVLAHLARASGRAQVSSWVQALGEDANRFLGSLANHPDASLARAAAAVLALAAPGGRLAAAPPELRVFALGRCEAYVHDRPVGGPDWNRAKVKLLLVGLLLRRGRPLSREEVTAWLWPDVAATAARTNLRVTLHGLKRALEPGLDAGSGSRYVHATREHLQLADTGRVWFDLWEFEDRINRGRQAMRQGARTEGLELLREAVSLWHGPLLPGPGFAGHLGERRARVEQAFVRTCLELAQDALGKGEARLAADYARRALTADPGTEPAYQLLIRAHLERGDREAAVHAFKACRKQLRSLLGVEPAPETARLLK